MVTALKPILIGKFGVKPCHRWLKLSGPKSYSPFVGTRTLALPAEFVSGQARIVMIEPFVTMRTFLAASKAERGQPLPI